MSKIKRCILGVLYYYFARFLPSGKFGKFARYHICKRIFKKCGKNVNVERLATFGNGFNIEIGDNSGIGVRADIPNDTIIGNNVMMAPNVCIFSVNHEFSSTDIPMIQQGNTEPKQTIIEDDVWIGRNVMMTPGRCIKKGSIIAAGCVLCKDFPEYSIVGGNPSKLIRNRKEIR